jgi:hypothetical protein
MGLDSNDFLADYTTDEFKQKAQEAMDKQDQIVQMNKELEQRKAQADAALQEANVAYTTAQAENTTQDNARQMAVAIDKHYQEWAKLSIQATKDGAQMPPSPDFSQIISMAQQLMESAEEKKMQHEGAETPQQEQQEGMM